MSGGRLGDPELIASCRREPRSILCDSESGAFSTSRVPACSAARSCTSRSWVKTGVSTSSPTTTPAWRAAIVQPPWIASGKRPRAQSA